MATIKNVVAQDIMVQPVKCAKPEEMLEDLEQRLMDSHLSGMPVVEGGEVIGFISKTDLVRLDVVRKALSGYVEERLPWIGSDQADPPTTNAAATTDHSQQGEPAIKQLTVREAMRSDVITCAPQTPVVEVAQLMVQHQIHRIVVVQEKDIVGIVSTLDLAKLLASSV
jgi:CBS domain-containing protein